MIPLDHHFNDLLNETIPFPLPKVEETIVPKTVPTRVRAEAVASEVPVVSGDFSSGDSIPAANSTLDYACNTLDCLCGPVATAAPSTPAPSTPVPSTPVPFTLKPSADRVKPASKVEITAKPTVPFEIDRNMVINRPRLTLKDSGLPVSLHPAEPDSSIVGESVLGFKLDSTVHPSSQETPLPAREIHGEVSDEILDLLEKPTATTERPSLKTFQPEEPKTFQPEEPKTFQPEETIDTITETLDDLLYEHACEIEDDFDEAISEAISVEKTPPVATTFFPMLQVDQYAWPSFCTDMHPIIKTQLNHLGELLITKSAKAGQKVVAVVGSGPGAGSTSILLGLASMLEAVGQKVAVVDADINSPTLAGSLGLQPECGWETVLAGKLPVEESLIDSIEDRIALLPLCLEASQKITFGVRPSENDRMNDAVRKMRDHYDLILVDLGSPEPADVAAFANFSEWIDSAVVVHNLRDDARSQLIRTKNMMRDYGVSVAGVAENFAPCETCFDDSAERAA